MTLSVRSTYRQPWSSARGVALESGHRELGTGFEQELHLNECVRPAGCVSVILEKVTEDHLWIEPPANCPLSNLYEVACAGAGCTGEAFAAIAQAIEPMHARIASQNAGDMTRHLRVREEHERERFEGATGPEIASLNK